MNPKPLTILFLSTGNAARGIMAEAILRHKSGGHRFSARSAGMYPMAEVSPETLVLLNGESISVAGLHTKGVGEFLAAARIVPIHVIVTLSEEARRECPIWPGDPIRVHWTVDDPLGCDKPDVREWKFRKCFTVLESRIGALIKTRVAQNSSELLLQLKDVGMVV